MSRYVLHPGWLRPDRYVGQAELRQAHAIPADADVLVIDGSHRRRFYSQDGDIHLHPESIEKEWRR